MGLVLWIDSNTFATGLLERVFKRRGIPFYALESAEDFSYLIDDLRPELLVLDGATARASGGALRRQYEASPALRALPVITIGDAADLALLENRVGQIDRPFDPFKIPDIIQEIRRRK
jgi:DNA-binding NtrC family response regulator